MDSSFVQWSQLVLSNCKYVYNWLQMLIVSFLLLLCFASKLHACLVMADVRVKSVMAASARPRLLCSCWYLWVGFVFNTRIIYTSYGIRPTAEDQLITWSRPHKRSPHHPSLRALSSFSTRVRLWVVCNKRCERKWKEVPVHKLSLEEGTKWIIIGLSWQLLVL